MSDEQRLEEVIQTMRKISKDGILPHSKVFDEARPKGVPSSRSLWACYTVGYSAIGSALGLKPAGRHNERNLLCDCGKKATSLRLIRVSSHHSKVLLLLCGECARMHDQVEAEDVSWRIPAQKIWRIE